MIPRAFVEAAAAEQAARRGFAALESVPIEHRDGVAQAAAAQLDLPRAEVRAALAIAWNESRGVAGQRVVGQAAPSTTQARAAPQTGLRGVAELQRAELQRPAAGDRGTVHKRGDRIDAALGKPEPTRVRDEVPFDQPTLVARRMRAIDARVVVPGLGGESDRPTKVGAYGGLRLDRIPADDPILDTPLFRGMGSADPGVHALLVSGRLIPAGRSNDYEGFKTYSHRAPLDGYEWSADAHIAMKSAGGHGYLLRTTLRELREQGVKDLARKVGDEEGGFFIEGAFQPAARPLVHVPGEYMLGPIRAKNTDPRAEVYARALGRKVVEAGGWDGIVDSGDRLAAPLAKAQLELLERQVSFWATRIDQLAPGSGVRTQARAQLARLAELPDPDARRDATRKLAQAMQLKAADLQPPDEPPVLDLSHL